MNDLKLAKRYGILASGTLVAKLLTFGSAALLGRFLGIEGFGIYGTAITLSGFLLIASNAGLDAIGTRETARNPDTIGVIAHDVLRLRLITGTILGSVVLVAASFMAMPLQLALPLCLLGITLALRIDWALIAIGADRAVVVAALVREGTFLALTVLVVLTTKSVAATLWAYVLADLVWALTTLALSRGLLRPSLQSRPRIRGLTLMKQGWPVAFMGFMSLTYNKIDTPLLTWLQGPKQAGVYYAAYTVVFAALCVIAPFTRLVLPEMSGERTDHCTGMRSTVRLCLLATVAGAGLGLFLVSSSKAILTGLYGSGFEPGVAALSILGWILVFNFPSSILLQRLVVDGRQGMLAVTASAAAAVNLSVNLTLIPRLGITGAAIATVASEITLLVIPIALYARVYTMRPFLRRFAWIGAAAVCAWGLGRMIPVQVPMLTALVTVSCYAILLLPLLRSFRRTEAAA